ncbi:MAG: SDR family NAD(P)-dependent oxidoreductase [Promethearchaeota archaeon]
MIKDFEGKVAVITGGASGIGFAMAKAFANKGMKVVIADINERSLKRSSRKLEKIGADILALNINVSDPKQVEKLSNTVYEKYGKVNILCNNAGTGGSGPAHLLEIGDWDLALQTNLYGVIYGIKYFLKRMLENNEPGHIINTASIAGLLSDGEQGPYSASKFAVVAISEYLTQQCFNTNISVSCLCPGFIKTSIVENFIVLREIRTDLDLYEEEEDEIKQIDSANFIKLVKDGMSPDLVAQMVIYAIENDIFYILTHHQWQKIFEARLERIKADTLKIKEKFFTSKEVKEKVYEYRTDSLAFSVSYPDYLIKMLPKTHENQVFHATEELRRGVEVYVIDIEPEFRLEDATTSMMDLFRYSGNDIQIISDEEITLEGGLIGREKQFTYNRLGAIKMRYQIVSVTKDNKLIHVITYAFDGYFDVHLKKIGRSLNFSASVAEILH